MSENQYDVLGIGNAMVDAVCDADDDFLQQHGLAKGAMTLIGDQQAEALYAKMKSPIQCSGGSAANTIAGLAAFGGSSVYLGKVKNDRLGELFRHDIRKTGVRFDVPAAQTGPPTGRCMVFVTPDAQRTMQTFLGASATFSPADLDPEAIRAAQIVYLEGYLWDPEPAKKAFLEAAEIAHTASRKVSLTLSDSFCVDRHRAEFQELVDKHVDVLFANEDEIVSLYQAADFEEAASLVREHCEMSAITLGARGSTVLTKQQVYKIDAEPVDKVVDTTGAGDLFASGFLFGLSRKMQPAECARLGGLASAEIISHFGARPEKSLKELAKLVVS
ncbi:MAG: adenosine kinase [Deltaproteobacteria bacterium]|nr:adenosine kinase [Deltaproteobacteria bacterium]